MAYVMLAVTTALVATTTLGGPLALWRWSRGAAVEFAALAALAAAATTAAMASVTSAPGAWVTLAVWLAGAASAVAARRVPSGLLHHAAQLGVALVCLAGVVATGAVALLAFAAATGQLGD